MSILVPILLTLSCLGLGAAVLRAARQLEALRPSECWTWSFSIGFGVLGWLLFPLGVSSLISPPVLLGLCLASLAGVILLLPYRPRWPRFSPPAAALVGLMVIVALGDLAEGLSPPADADSLAYHFFIPKLFVEAERIFFIPRASDGAAPLLPQMAYTAALALGGERALTLWMTLTGWAAVGLAYTLSRRYLNTTWSLVVALLLATLPAVLYGAGTGQVEIRTTLFVLVSAFALADSRNGSRGAIVLAGLSAGFYAASKYPGLIFVLGGTIVLVCLRRRIVDVALFSIAAAIAGCQWYLWNAWNTGDPFFPLLYGTLPYHADIAWNAAQDAFMRADFFGSEKAMPATFIGLIIYPFAATFWPDTAFDAGRVGLGVVFVLLLPYAVAGAWQFRSRLGTHPLTPVLAVALFFYTVWFFFGPSQRVRHLLPVAALALIPMIVAAVRALEIWPALRLPLLAGIAATLVLQIGGQAIAIAKYARHLLSSETRAAFLDRSVVAWPLVDWANVNLGPTERLFINIRQLNYLFTVPIFYAHPQVQAEVEVRPDSTDLGLFWRQLRRAGITHGAGTVTPEPQPGADGLFQRLQAAGCADAVRDFEVRGYASRTLPRDEGRAHTRLRLYRLLPGSCGLP